MRDYGKISPAFWTGETGRLIVDSGPEAVVVALYLMTSPHANMLGLYYLPVAYIAHDTGLTMQGASKGLQRAIEAGLCGYDEAKQVVWVFEMARYQIDDQLKEGDKRVVGVNKEYEKLPKCLFLCDFFDKYQAAFYLKKRRGIEAPSKPLRSQEQEQEQEQDNLEVILTSVGQGSPTPCSADDENKIEQQQRPEQIPYAEIIGKLNTTCGCQFKADTQATRRHIKARWNEGWRFDDFAAVIDNRFAEWGTDPKMCQFVRPETLFGTKFESYLQLARNGRASPHPTESSVPSEAAQAEMVRKAREARAAREQREREKNGEVSDAAAQ